MSLKKKLFLRENIFFPKKKRKRFLKQKLSLRIKSFYFILYFLTHTHEERGEGFKETDSGVNPKEF